MSRVEARFRYNSGVVDPWQPLFEFSEDGTGQGNVNVGLSWRILGTTAGGAENFCAYESIVGTVAISSKKNYDNSITISLTKTAAQTKYDVNKPNNQVVGATFTGGVFNADAGYSSHTKADGEAVGDSSIVHSETRSEQFNTTVSASTASGETVFGSMAENATNTKVWCDFRVVNTLPPDYRPGQRRINNSWQSHNRPSGKCQRRVNNNWVEMRTLDGTGNPPSRMVNNAWVNQKKIGQE